MPSDHNRPNLSLGVPPFSFPEWLKRVELSVEHGSEKPRYSIQTVQPLYQSRDQTHTLFVQPRFSSVDQDWTTNLGLGYRELFVDRQILGGLNTSYDHADKHNHYRLGVGLELLGRYLELRTNGYFPLSERRTVGEDANQTVYERALKGMDVEAGGPVPYMPSLKLYGSYAYYDYTKDIDSHIGKFRAELKLTRFLRLDAETWNDNKAPWGYRIGLVLTMDLERPWDLFFKPSAEAYPHKDMRHMTLHRVVRARDITFESWTQSKAPRSTNQNPTVTMDSPAGNLTIDAGDFVNFQSTAGDPDGDPLTFTWTVTVVALGLAPNIANVEDPGAVTFNNPGTYDVSVSVSDGRGGVATSVTRRITVTLGGG